MEQPVEPGSNGWSITNEVVRQDFRLFHRHFVARVVPAGANGELPRAAGRFALAAAAGELATEVGITGWQEGDSVKAAEALWAAWVNQRSTKATDEESAVRQVRAFLEAHGSSRFQRIAKGIDGIALDSQEKVLNRAGFCEITPGGSTYLILPEVFLSGSTVLRTGFWIDTSPLKRWRMESRACIRNLVHWSWLPPFAFAYVITRNQADLPAS